MTPQQELIYYRTILLDETKSNLERKNAQNKVMELCRIKEDNNTKMEETSKNGI